MTLIKGPTGQYFSVEKGKASAVEHQGSKVSKTAPSFDMSAHAGASAQMFPI